MEDADYEASNYTAPNVVSFVSKCLSFTRFYGSKDFADLVSPDYNEQKDYTYGLVIFVSIAASLLFIWASVLIVLKYQGDIVGCASGRPFKISKEEDVVQSSGSDPTTQMEDFTSSIASSEFADEPESTNQDGKGESEKTITAVKRRRRRTRITFFVCGIIILVCASLLLVFSFAPIRQSTHSTDDLVEASQEILDQIKASVRTVESASEHANETLYSVPLNIHQICPGYTNETDFGVDLKALVTLVVKEFDKLQNVITSNTTRVNHTLTLIQDTVDKVQELTEKSNDNLWIYPATLLVVFVIITGALVAAILSWTGKSSSRFERRLAYGVLPLLVVVAVACWIIAAGAAIASLISSDACIGNPDATVQAILEKYNVDTNSTGSQFITVYTNGCKGNDPTDRFEQIEKDLQNEIDSIWSHISTVDSVGRQELSEKCGKNLDEIMAGARNLARSLTWIRKALISAIASLRCAPINAIYVAAVHDSFCTEGARGVAVAFLLFSVIAISGLTMVSLRASLYSHVVEDVYDESEEAENMILNEHEEYLAYISKYKHEWEEYRGINAGESFEDGEQSIHSGSASESWTGRSEEGSLADPSEVEEWSDELPESDSEHDYGSIGSTPTDDISFPSLNGSPLNSTDEEYIPPPIPPSMLGAPPDDQEENDDKEPVFFPVVSAVPVGSEDSNVEVHLSKSGKGVPVHAGEKESRNDRYTPRASASNRDGQLSSKMPELDWNPSFSQVEGKNKIAASHGEIEISLTQSNSQKDVVKKAASMTSPEILDNLSYYSRNDLPCSPTTAQSKSRKITKASPKMKLVIGKFEEI